MNILFTLLSALGAVSARETGLTLLPTGPGPEDMELIPWGPAGGQALITATARRLLPWQAPQGALEIHEIGGEPRFTPLPQVYPGGEWKPLALGWVRRSTVPAYAGKDLLYVLNDHATRGTVGGRVEIFELQAEAKMLKHLATLGPTPLMSRANSLVATRDGTVYLSCFSLFPQGRRQPTLTPVRDRATSHALIRYREGEWRVVAAGINGANGLSLTPDEKHLLCNAYYARQVLAFERDPTSGDLTKFDIILDDLPFCPDNLKPLPNGEYCSAGQRSYLVAGLHFLTLTAFPTRGAAVNFTYTPGQKAEVTHGWKQAMQGDTRCPSTAIPHRDHLYLSHILKSGVMRVNLRK